jgi:hypothetical protein
MGRSSAAGADRPCCRPKLLRPPTSLRPRSNRRGMRPTSFRSEATAEEPMVCGLSAGGNRIRTIGPALVKGLSAVADEKCRTISWMGSSSTGRLAKRRWSAAGLSRRSSLSRRDRRFESIPLQQRVCKLSVPRGASRNWRERWRADAKAAQLAAGRLVWDCLL